MTGASSGIGRATALRFARGGASVLVVGRSEAALAEVAAAVECEGGRSATLAADVTHSDAPARIVDAALNHLGGLTTLVNAAGVIGSGSIETTTDEQWDAMRTSIRARPFV